jgi:hypothetical protein
MNTEQPTSNERKRHTGLRAVAATCTVALAATVGIAGFAFGHYSASQSAAAAPADHAAASPAGGATPAPAASNGHAVPSGAIAAIKNYETANGPGAGRWAISSSRVSTANPAYVFFRIGPARGFEDTVQGGYGFAQSSGGTWHVVGFGSALVGCSTSESQAPVVPSVVLKEFGFSCPPS